MKFSLIWRDRLVVFPAAACPAVSIKSIAYMKLSGSDMIFHLQYSAIFSLAEG